jgi:anti-anti-sigma factor
MNEQAALALGPELTIAHAAHWHQRLAEASGAGGDLVLDLAGVTDFDSAGVQLLLSARRSLAEAGAQLVLRSASRTVRDALQVLALDDLLPAA